MKKDIHNTPIVKLIRAWILHLMGNHPFYYLDSQFEIEDGMNFSQYLAYEKEQFLLLSEIFDLNEQFDIQIIHQLAQKDKTIVYFYLLNAQKRIVCKMNVTVVIKNEICYLTGNDYLTQFVPKYRICANSEQITHIALALKSALPINSIVCPQASCENFGKGDNFQQDAFYHALFTSPEIEFNKTIDFYLKFEGAAQKIEKRKIFFDIFDKSLIPFLKHDNMLSTYDEHYPVHLSYWKNGINYNFEYPRGVWIDTTEVEKITITDCLDNDWVIL